MLLFIIIAERKLHSARWDEEKYLDRDIFAKAAELGFMGMYSSEDYGGTSLSRLCPIPP